MPAELPSGAPKIDLRRDSGALINAVTGLGGASDSLTQTHVGRATQLNQQEMDELAQVWPLDVMCSAFPDAAVAKWCELTLPQGCDESVLQKSNQYRSVVASRTKANDLRDEELASDADVFAWAGYLANVYRGAAIVMNIDDGRHPSQPIDTENIRTIKELTVLDSFQIYPELTNIDNPLEATHYNIMLAVQRSPELQRMFANPDVAAQPGSLNRFGSLSSFAIHRSRVLRIPGVRVPPRVMRQNNGWDRSLLEKVWEQYAQWVDSNAAVRDLISDYSLFVYQLSGLGNLMTSSNEEDEQAVSNRVRTLFMMAKVLGGIMLDKEDEDVTFVQRSFSGLEPLLETYRDMLIGASGIPHTRLFGESPSGLGATGESEEKTWAGSVEAYRARVFDGRVRRLYELIFLAQDGPTGGKRLEGWDIVWPKLIEQTQSEVVQDRLTQAGIDQAYQTIGVLSADEIRRSRFGAAYSHETNIAAPPPALTENLPEDSEPSPAIEEEEGLPDSVPDFAVDDDLYRQARLESKQRFILDSSAYALAWTEQRYLELRRQRR